ncbi:hypothetical protein SEA_OCTOBIEN14_40 [Gordonia phage Octobien14]|uniref:Uncharacterized protein n=1 Tax=Gordonia phage Octobien14 TaxID=2483673 RepID=A0A3G3MAS5_9CAUD|nr:hypothetical protein L3Y22_gp040 [Gordonia phage Octobien14]AYR03188.1 hypothetical protein SEA_OCTOBIEN14_40 [Gordonia phage Octobien14]
MKTFVTFLVGIACIVIGMSVAPTLAGIGFLLIAVSLLIGFFKLVKVGEEEQHKQDLQKIRNAGGTEAEALIYANLERQRRDSWFQAAAQMKK